MSRKCSKGFTLIEILIVVVIIGVLAALIIPRMFGNIEAANLAEATMTIGALVRAQQEYMDLNGTDPLVVTCFNPPANCTSANVGKLGLADIKQNKFKYACIVNPGADGYCQARRWISGAATGLVYQYIFNVANPENLGRWYCGGAPDNYVRQDTGTVGLAPAGVACRADF